MYVKENGVWRVNYIGRDYLGSITYITDKDGKLKEELSYDAWGRLRNPDNQVVYTLGEEPEPVLGGRYTGHEHLPMFGPVNMNARLYDPVVGLFLSPDPYVQAPWMTQNFNRYSYALNNPLRYTDITGEWFGIDDLIVAGAAFIMGYTTHGITSGNWGWNAVAAGGKSAGMAWLGYNTAGIATGAISNTTWNHIGEMAINTAVNQIVPSMTIPINKHFGLSVSLGLGRGTSGLTGGMNLGGAYSNGKFSIGGGIGIGTNHWGWNGAMTYDGWGAGYGRTYYSASTVAGQQYGNQTAGTATAYFNHNSFVFSNDALGDKEDRWRTFAAELNIGRYSVGSQLYTNWGSGESPEVNGKRAYDGSAKLLKQNKKGAWNNGRVHFAPAWVGYKNKKGQTTRIGFSHPMVQNLTQNLIHKYVTPTPYFLNYDEFRSGGYFYFGYYNPHSLWEK